MGWSGRLAGVLVGLVGLVGAPLVVLVLTSAPAGAITLTPLTVDNAGDGAAVSTNCAPIPVAGQCRLRDAFAAASTGGADASIDIVVDIPASVGAITLTSGSLSYDGGGAGHSLTVIGNGNTITQSTANSRVITSSTSGTLTVTGLTLTGGANVCRGGAVRANGALVINSSTITNNSSTCGGGGVFAGSVTATGSTFTNNHANGGSGGAIETPGPDTVTGTVTLTSSTVSTNTARNGGGGIDSGAQATVTRSTIDHNTASQTFHGDGGGLEAASVVIVNSTITNNTDAGDPGGGIYVEGGTATLDYVTIANNSSPTGANIANGGTLTTLTSFGSVVANPLGGGTNCEGTTSASMGFNWDQDGSCAFGAASDHSNAGDPQLGALADNGGPTQTLLPQTGSRLIDAIPVASCRADGASGITTDQRGVTRPQGAGCDIGAVEVQVTAPSPVVITPKFTG